MLLGDEAKRQLEQEPVKREPRWSITWQQHMVAEAKAEAARTASWERAKAFYDAVQRKED